MGTLWKSNWAPLKSDGQLLISFKEDEVLMTNVLTIIPSYTGNGYTLEIQLSCLKSDGQLSCTLVIVVSLAKLPV